MNNRSAFCNARDFCQKCVILAIISTTMEVIYQDEYLVAVNKPHGLLVHPSSIAKDAEEFAMQLLRDQLGQYVFPVHRLDRKTGGVLLFALDTKAHRAAQQQFAERDVQKEYWAIVRGYTDDSGEIDYPLKKENGKSQEAFTAYETMARAELPVPLGKHATVRYSLVKISPLTGRMHQIRKHMAHILHPIIGDRPHGCNKQNRLFKEKWGMTTMLLHARALTLAHPITTEPLKLMAPVQAEFKRMMELMDFNL